MKNLTFVVLLGALLAVLLKQTASSTVEHFVGDKDEKFLQILKRARQYKRTAASLSHSTIPMSPTPTTITGSKLILNSDREKMTDQTKCAPHPIPVRLPTSSVHAPTLPYVSLHRCLGSDSYLSRLGFQCKVKSQEEVRVQYKDLFHGWQLAEVKIFNHTDCLFECQETCGPNQKFYPDYCDCLCMITAANCTSKQIFDSQDCECKCKLPVDCSYNIYKSYNHKTCQCECDQRLKDICSENNNDIDQVSCRCKPKTSNSV